MPIGLGGLFLDLGQTETGDGRIGLGILLSDDTADELCDIQAEKKEAAKK